MTGPSSEQSEQTEWRQWASLGYSLFTSLLLIGVIVGSALGSVVEVGPDTVRHLPPLLRGMLFWSLALAFGSLLLWGLLAWLARLFGVPRTRPVALSMIWWLVSAEERFDRRLRRKDR